VNKKLEFINISLHLLIPILLLFSISYLMIFRPSGYELNLFSTYPIFFWIILIILYLFVLAFGILNKRKIIIYLLIFTILYLLIFTISSEYVLSSRSDDFSHIGEIINIERVGKISDNNIYPISHIYFSIIKSISSIDIIQLKNLLYPFLSLLFVLFSFCIVNNYINKHRKNITNKFLYIILPFLFIYFLAEYHFTIRPHFFAFIIFPVSILLVDKYLERREKRYFILFAIMSIIMPMTHPLFGFTFLGTIVIIILVKYLFVIRNISRLRSSIRLILISIIPTLTWYIYNKSIYDVLSRRIQQFFFEIGPSVGSRTFNLLNIGNFTFFELFSRGILLYLGRYLFLGLILVLYFIKMANYRKKNRKKLVLNNLIKELFLISILLIFWQLFFIIGPLTSHNPQRFINLNISIFFMLPLVIMITLIHFSKKNQKIIFSIIIICQITSTMIVFPSPIIYQPDTSLTSNEIYGMNWFEKTKNNLNIYEFNGQLVDRYYDYLEGFNPTENKKYVRESKFFIDSVTNGSGLTRLLYDKYENFPIKNYYIVLTSFGIEPYLNIEKWKNTGKLYQEDIEHFNNDNNIIKIFISKDIILYKS